jgi:hypothetical protein
VLAKGGGSEGKGPKSKRKKSKGKERANQAQSEGTNVDEKEVAYLSNGKPSPHITKDSWVADSATTSHICNKRESFNSYVPLTSKSIEGLGGKSISALGIGKVDIKCKVEGKIVTNSLQNVLYAPDAVNNLISIIKLDNAGGRATFGEDSVNLPIRTEN